ncbi:hypothetical protein KIPB_007286 [Kipferlia bialata]|uniref:Uncharacterized protein n=1 Tax=Kipferlia bialata TaxID=797122 RepID=A0A9K3CZ18_9EUKA|nr:hypothetical protein KIPB_007286 [Kipferlia bialata]
MAELGCLPHLEFLSLKNNSLSSALPPEICQDSALRHINLDSAGIVGALPECVCGMPNLVTLSVSENSLDSDIPQCMGGYESPLEVFRANCSGVTGSVPDGLTDGSVTDVQLRCNPSLECPSTSDLHSDGYFTCGVVGCEESCLQVLELPGGCEEVIFPNGGVCGPYFLDVPPCQLFAITGTVVEDGTSDGIPDVTVTVYPPASLAPLASTLTSTDGMYSIDLTQYAGDFATLRVEFVKEGEYVMRTEIVTVPLCGLVELDTSLVPIVFPPPPTCDTGVCVTVLDECGYPIPGATVAIVSCNEGLETDTADTDEDGVACFDILDILPPTEVQVSVCAEGYTPTTTGVTIPDCLDAISLTIDLLCIEAPSLYVEVTTADPFAAAAAGATVTWESISGLYGGMGVTDVSGSVHFEIPAEVVDTDVTIIVDGIEGYLPYSDGMMYTVPCCGPLVVPQIVPCTEQSVCVSVSEDCYEEEPVYIGGVTISYYDPADPETLLGTTVSDATTATCLYLLPELVAYPLTAVTAVFTYDNTEYSRDIPLVCGEVETCIEVECVHHLSGRVTSVTGEALSGVTVSIDTDPVLSTATDADGYYAIEGVMEGEYTITFTPPEGSEYDEVIYLDVEVPLCGCIVLDAVLPCVTPPSLWVTFTDPCGDTPTDLTATLYLNGTVYPGTVNGGAVAHWSLPETGDAVLTWESDTYLCGSRSITIGCGSHTDHVTLSCRDALTLIVKVFTADPLDAVPGATVTFTTVGGGSTDSAVTDLTGTATLSLPAASAETEINIEVTGIAGYPPYSDGINYTVPCCGTLAIEQDVPFCDVPPSLCATFVDPCGDVPVGVNTALFVENTLFLSPADPATGEVCFTNLPMGNGALFFDGPEYQSGILITSLTCDHVDLGDIQLLCTEPRSLDVKVTLLSPYYDQNPVEGIEVMWMTTMPLGMGTATTDTDGIARFTDLPAVDADFEVMVVVPPELGIGIFVPYILPEGPFTLPCCGGEVIQAYVPCDEQSICFDGDFHIHIAIGIDGYNLVIKYYDSCTGDLISQCEFGPDTHIDLDLPDVIWDHYFELKRWLRAIEFPTFHDILDLVEWPKVETCDEFFERLGWGECPDSLHDIIPWPQCKEEFWALLDKIHLPNIPSLHDLWDLVEWPECPEWPDCDELWETLGWDGCPYSLRDLKEWIKCPEWPDCPALHDLLDDLYLPRLPSIHDLHDLFDLHDLWDLPEWPKCSEWPECQELWDMMGWDECPYSLRDLKEWIHCPDWPHCDMLEGLLDEIYHPELPNVHDLWDLIDWPTCAEWPECQELWDKMGWDECPRVA